jgi:AraC-like DNA-binding protein
LSPVLWPERTFSQIKQPLNPDSELNSQSRDLVMGQRIDQFREDLRHMSDIALSCQFSSHASFNRAFRRAIGVTPGEIPSG